MISTKVNIGILWSISHHIQCLNSQQLFDYITLKSKERNKQIVQQHYLHFFYYHHMSRVMRKHTFSMYDNEDADQLRGNRATFRSASLLFFSLQR